MAAAWDDLPATGGLGECGALVRSAEVLRVSAPELAVQLARRAMLVGATTSSGTVAGFSDADMLSLRAQAALAGGLVRISQHTAAVEPGFAALALAETGGLTEVAAEIRLDLAACAQEVGEPLLGGALLRPVLEATQAPPSLRAAALGRLVGCVAHVARRDDIEDALTEADRLLAADDSLPPDARRMERARLAVRSAVYHRWYGDTEDAANVARDGLAQLGRLRRESRSESDQLRARLVLELVCALLDDGELRDAEAAASPTVDEPVRATSAAAVGQLMLAVATRVHLPAGEVDRGRGLLDQAAWLAERHGLDSLLADALTEVARLDELAGRASDALVAVRAARAAEQRRLRAVARAARLVLTEVGAGMGAKDVTQQAVAALLRQLAHPAGVPVSMAPPLPTPPSVTRSPLPPPRSSLEPHAALVEERPVVTASAPTAADSTARTDAGQSDTGQSDTGRTDTGQTETDKGTGLLNREGLIRRLRSVRTGERPVTLTLLRFEPSNEGADPAEPDRGPDTGTMVGLADKVRHMAPDNAELARPEGGELAVLLPDTTRDQAEEFAASVRETAMGSDWLSDARGQDMSISTGVVEGADNNRGDEAGMLTAARDALTPAAATTDTAAALNSALSEETPTKPRPGTEVTQQPNAALYEETPTTPINVAESLPVGRSILSTLSIPSGSGGRRRADGEPAPGAGGETRWPSEQPEPQKWTRAERRAREAATQDQESAPPPPPFPVTTGWPAEPDISQPLHPPARNRPAHNPSDTELSAPLTSTPHPAELQSFGHPDQQPTTTPSTGVGEASSSQQLPEAKPTEEAPPTPAPADTAAADHTGYDDTRAELAQMMSQLNARSRRSRQADRDEAIQSAQSSIPTPPDPSEIPTSPGGPDIPDPDEPSPIPPTPPDPGPIHPDEPGPPPPDSSGPPSIEDTLAPKSGLMAALDALSGPMEFKADFESPAGLPSRKPLKSWAELQSAATVDSPADGLFGRQAEKPTTEVRSSLGAAFTEFAPEPEGLTSEQPRPKRVPHQSTQPANDATPTTNPSAAESPWPTTDPQNPVDEPPWPATDQPAQPGTDLVRRAGTALTPRSTPATSSPERAEPPDPAPSTTEPAAWPASASTSWPTPNPATEPTPEPPSWSATEQASQSAEESAGEQISRTIAESARWSATEQAQRPMADPPPWSASDPATRSAAESAAQQAVAQSVGEPSSWPAAEQAAAQSAGEPSSWSAGEQVQRPMADPPPWSASDPATRSAAESAAQQAAAQSVGEPSSWPAGEQASRAAAEPPSWSAQASRSAPSVGESKPRLGTEPTKPPVPAPASARSEAMPRRAADLVTRPDPVPVYDKPLGPEPRPESAVTPRRERSATTIASLLTEALAAYQSSTEEEHPRPPAQPDPFDSFLRDSTRDALHNQTRDSVADKPPGYDSAYRDLPHETTRRETTRRETTRDVPRETTRRDYALDATPLAETSDATRRATHAESLDARHTTHAESPNARHTTPAETFDPTRHAIDAESLDPTRHATHDSTSGMPNPTEHATHDSMPGMPNPTGHATPDGMPATPGISDPDWHSTREITREPATHRSDSGHRGEDDLGSAAESTQLGERGRHRSPE